MTEMEDRNGGIESRLRVLAMDSSSVAAAECVSRSESLLRHTSTRCLNSRAEDWLLGVCLASDIVEVLGKTKVLQGGGGGLSVNSGSMAGERMAVRCGGAEIGRAHV